MSLSIGAHVYKRLSDSTELAKLVSDKIYAIIIKLIVLILLNK